MGQKSPGVVPYARPGEPEPKRPLDRYCVAALVVSFFSCAFPLIAAIAIGLAIIGLVRRRRTQARGIDYAVTGIVFSVVGVLVFIRALSGASSARAVSLNLDCMATLRQIGQFVVMYENKYPNARSYQLGDVVAFSPQLKGSLTCPSSPIPATTASAATRPCSYVLLTSLEPFGRLRNDANTIIAFELSPHHVSAYDGFPESDHINALFADGHVESLPLDRAAGEIEKSLLAPHRPSRRQATQPGAPEN